MLVSASLPRNCVSRAALRGAKSAQGRPQTRVACLSLHRPVGSVAWESTKTPGKSPHARRRYGVVRPTPRLRLLKVEGKPAPKPEEVDTVCYHGGCWDGMGAAFSAWKLLGDKATYTPAQHRGPVPRVAGKNVALLDMVYQPVILASVLSLARSTIVLDHHISAEDEMQHVPAQNKVFDHTKSGARLAWEFFHPDEPLPKFLEFIEDRDLWTWKLENSRDFNHGLMATPLTMENFDEIYRGGDSAIEALIESGRHISTHVNRTYKMLTRRSARLRFLATGATCRVVNSATDKSEIANELLLSDPEASIAVVWHFDHHYNQARLSLRSRQEDEKTDVSTIARSFGGGGHRCAASFNYDQPIKKLFAPFPKKKTGKKNDSNVAETAAATHVIGEQQQKDPSAAQNSSDASDAADSSSAASDASDFTVDVGDAGGVDV